jgi:hypothetical protein
MMKTPTRIVGSPLCVCLGWKTLFQNTRCLGRFTNHHIAVNGEYLWQDEKTPGSSGIELYGKAKRP